MATWQDIAEDAAIAIAVGEGLHLANKGVKAVRHKADKKALERVKGARMAAENAQKLVVGAREQRIRTQQGYRQAAETLNTRVANWNAARQRQADVHGHEGVARANATAAAQERLMQLNAPFARTIAEFREAGLSFPTYAFTGRDRRADSPWRGTLLRAEQSGALGSHPSFNLLDFGMADGPLMLDSRGGVSSFHGPSRKDNMKTVLKGLREENVRIDKEIADANQGVRDAGAQLTEAQGAFAEAEQNFLAPDPVSAVMSDMGTVAELAAYQGFRRRHLAAKRARGELQSGPQVRSPFVPTGVIPQPERPGPWRRSQPGHKLPREKVGEGPERRVPEPDGWLDRTFGFIDNYMVPFAGSSKAHPWMSKLGKLATTGVASAYVYGGLKSSADEEANKAKVEYQSAVNRTNLVNQATAAIDAASKLTSDSFMSPDATAKLRTGVRAHFALGSMDKSTMQDRLNAAAELVASKMDDREAYNYGKTAWDTMTVDERKEYAEELGIAPSQPLRDAGNEKARWFGRQRMLVDGYRDAMGANGPVKLFPDKEGER